MVASPVEQNLALPHAWLCERLLSSGETRAARPYGDRAQRRSETSASVGSTIAPSVLLLLKFGSRAVSSLCVRRGSEPFVRSDSVIGRAAVRLMRALDAQHHGH
jgi:hypothetical protein